MSSMFNFDGQIVAGVIQTQQTGEVFRSILDSRRARKAEDIQEVFALQQHYAQLLARYNNLVNQYNGVLAENKRVDAAHTAKIAEKDERIAELTAEKEESRKSAYEAWSKHWEALDEIERLKIKAGELPPDESNHNSAA